MSERYRYFSNQSRCVSAQDISAPWLASLCNELNRKMVTLSHCPNIDTLLTSIIPSWKAGGMMPPTHAQERSVGISALASPLTFMDVCGADWPARVLAMIIEGAVEPKRTRFILPSQGQQNPESASLLQSGE